jgi:alkylation response protein AidB-like acyl-CoA dehydrogenase
MPASSSELAATSDFYAPESPIHRCGPEEQKQEWLRDGDTWVLNGLLEYDVARFVADSDATYSYDGTRETNSLMVGVAIPGESAFVGRQGRP